jgi:hypothetical protein
MNPAHGVLNKTLTCKMAIIGLKWSLITDVVDNHSPSLFFKSIALSLL